jgi:YVTN family beta-propeller protein
LATTAIVALLAATSAHAQQGPFLYVPNSGSNDLFVVDTSTNSVTAGPIPMGLNPIGVAVKGDQSLAYVTNFKPPIPSQKPGSNRKNKIG